MIRCVGLVLVCVLGQASALRGASLLWVWLGWD